VSGRGSGRKSEREMESGRGEEDLRVTSGRTIGKGKWVGRG